MLPLAGRRHWWHRKVQRRAVSNAAVPGEAQGRILLGAAFLLGEPPNATATATQTGLWNEQAEYDVDFGMAS